MPIIHPQTNTQFVTKFLSALKKSTSRHDRGDRYHYDAAQGQPGQIEAYLNEESDSSCILPYSESDRDGNAYTIQTGDNITFYLATDRRNGQKRAIRVQVC